MIPDLPPSQSSIIIPYLNLELTPYFMYKYFGWCQFVDHFLVDEETSTFVKQSMNDKPYQFRIKMSHRVNSMYDYKISVSILLK